MSSSDNNNIVSLNKTKKLKEVINDLNVCLDIIDVNIKGLNPYLKYKQIAELYSVLDTNREILEAKILKYKRELNGQEKQES